MCMPSTSITITARVILAGFLLLDLDHQCSSALLWAPLGTNSEFDSIFIGLYLYLECLIVNSLRSCGFG